MDTFLGLDPKLVTLLQIGVSTLLSLAGFFVGAVALFVSYRNNFGWAPVVWAHKRWDGSDDKDVWAGAEFEIWNRRKYSVVVRVVEIDFGYATVTDAAVRRMPNGDKWERGMGSAHLSVADSETDGIGHTIRNYRDDVSCGMSVVSLLSRSLEQNNFRGCPAIKLL